MFPAEVVVLGPQRLAPSVDEAVRELGIDPAKGRFALVTAGWEEREPEDDELRAHLGGNVRNLALFERVEDVFRRDPGLLSAMQQRHDRMRMLQRLYRLRLGHAMEAARELLREDRTGEDPELRAAEADSAIDAVRALDDHHTERIRELHAAFQEEVRPREREAVARHREELAAEIEGCDAVLVAGGHVTVLLNRLRLLDVVPMIGERPIVCWSAGAMALSERVVVFHDSPPQGQGNAEVLETGLGVFSDLVPLPHAKRRLRLTDPVRVALFARRFRPSAAVALDEGASARWDGRKWTTRPGTRLLGADGAVAEVSAA